MQNRRCSQPRKVPPAAIVYTVHINLSVVVDIVHIDVPYSPDKMNHTAAAPQPRSTYRHGNLRRALTDAGIELARAGGPDAVTLREATRRAGVVPNAAYRHFAGRQVLLQAVRSAALAAVAASMETELSALTPGLAPADQARARLRAIGIGYLQFARAEPGLFRTAFATPLQPGSVEMAESGGDTGPNPFRILGGALDAMAEADVLPPERRPDAEFLAWSAVHGLAMLVLDGPLSGMDRPRIDALIPRLLEMVEKGL
jgi:AcrR family transcriptional regulator